MIDIQEVINCVESCHYKGQEGAVDEDLSFEKVQEVIRSMCERKKPQ
jgi:hypothetical protein